MGDKKNLMLMVPMLHQGGFERVCVKTARLMQEYYNVYILIFTSRDMFYDVSGLNVIDIDVPASDGRINKVLNVLKRVRKVKKIKKELGIDISYSFGGSANYVNALSGIGEKLYTGLRGQTDLDYPRQIKLFCKKSTKVIACSKGIVDQLVSDFGYKNGTYVYNPLDVAEVQQKAKEAVSDMPFEDVAGARNSDSTGNPEDAKVIVTLGRDDYLKGFWHLLKAFSLVAKEHPEARLLILGDGDWTRYEELADKLGVKDKVSFPGAKKNPFPYLAASDIYVCTSNHEGFPNAVLEAMALKKPIISTDCRTGPREILLDQEEYRDITKKFPGGESAKEPVEGTFGILVPNMDDTENLDPDRITEEEKVLAAEFSRMLENKELMERYSRKSLERAGEYTPDRYAENLRAIFEK